MDAWVVMQFHGIELNALFTKLTAKYNSTTFCGANKIYIDSQITKKSILDRDMYTKLLKRVLVEYIEIRSIEILM
jgi:hypothetical protein